MHLRSLRERVIQTLYYEAGGLLLVTPAYGWATGHTTSDSLVVLIAVSIGTMAWAALHNTVFDLAECRVANRVASDRPHRWRLLHACSTEATSIIVTTPIIMLAGGFGFWEALLIDIGLTIAYAAYGYLYHLVFDRLRPVTAPGPALALTGQPAGFSARPMAASRGPSGIHIMIDGYDGPHQLLNDEGYLHRLLRGLPLHIGFGEATTLQVMQAQQIMGYHGYASAAGGHIMIRTFPDQGFVSMDIHTIRRDVDRQFLADVIKFAFSLSSADVFMQERGLKFVRHDSSAAEVRHRPSTSQLRHVAS